MNSALREGSRGEWMWGKCRTLLLAVHGCGQAVREWEFEGLMNSVT